MRKTVTRTGNSIPRITISYRRDDSAIITGRVFDRLVARYGRNTVFRDIDHIPIGYDFRRHIERIFDSTDVVLAVVGPRWCGPETDSNRLKSPDDPVRVEIEIALKKNTHIIPVLVLGAKMPTRDDLPDELEKFTYLNAARVDAELDFEVHIDRLTRAIDQVLKDRAIAHKATLRQERIHERRRKLLEFPRRARAPIFALMFVSAVIAAWYRSTAPYLDSVEIKDIVVGQGMPAQAGSIVSVTFIGRLENGTVVHATASADKPYEFTIGAKDTLKGFQLGVQGMRVGGERTVHVPPSLGYGKGDMRDSKGRVLIPANSNLVYEIKLLAIRPENPASK